MALAKASRLAGVGKLLVSKSLISANFESSQDGSCRMEPADEVPTVG